MTNLTPSIHDFWFLPLGGCGEIGMNMNLYGHNGQWLMVDCGVTFEKSPQGQDRTYSADPSFIASRKDSLCGLVITHAHQDHVGAVANLWPQLRCPIYTTPFTAFILRAKLRELGIEQNVTIHEVAVNAKINVGPFALTWFLQTHSIPEPCALIIETHLGRVFHTADWKLDPNPVVGQPYNQQAFEHLGQKGCDVVVCDSTNATIAGHSMSEAEVGRNLVNTIKPLKGRVLVTCFGSNVARLVSIARAAKKCGRYVGVIGRSMQLMINAAKTTGYWPDDLPLADARHLGYLPKEEVLILTTGSQGEPRASLARMAKQTHPFLELDADDTVIFSAKTIPGNEDAVKKLTSQLKLRKVDIIHAQTSPLCLHASGHPCQDELQKVYTWLKPRCVIPVHGEQQHMQANAHIAKQAGAKYTLTGKNGDLFTLAPMRSVKKGVTPERRFEIV